MKFDSLLFLAFSFVAVAAIRFCSPGRLRDFVICGVNVLFILFCVQGAQLLSFELQDVTLALKLSSPVIFFVVMGYLAVFTAARLHSVRGVVPGVIFMVIATFIWLKRYSLIAFMPTLSPIFTTIGLSYILFRILHIVIDVAQGSMRIPGFVAYLGYITFFLNFVSGPIQRYPDFAEQAARRPAPMTYQDVYASIGRIVAGYFLIIPVSVVTSALSEKFTILFYAAVNSDGIMSYDIQCMLSVAAAVQLVNLFVNFYGYMHIVIGIGCLAGFRLPENFNYPFRSENFLDFWARWHITLSEWFKYYLFNPLLKALAFRWGTPHATPYLGAVAFFVTFLVIGVWHGTSLNYVLVGLLFGLGVSVNKIWQIEASGRLGKSRYKELCQQQWYKNISRSLALSYFSITLTCYWLLPKIFSHVSLIELLGTCIFSFLILVSVGTLILIAADYIKGWINTLRFPPIARLINKLSKPVSEWSEFRFAVWTGVKLFILANCAALTSGSVPDFIYKTF